MEEETFEIIEEKKTNSEVLEEAVVQYVEYIDVDSKKEQEKFNETVEEMLTKLDEFCTLVDMVRGDTSICLAETLPKIQAKCEDMRKTFNRIDQLEEFVGVVRDHVSAMEECVNKAEDRMGSFSGLKKMLSSFVTTKKANAKDDKGSKFESPPIFKTSEYLKSTQVKEKSKTENVKTQEASKTDSNKSTTTQRTISAEESPDSKS
ncbi:hypothetical protein FSP39_015430 [Pinctada imbricata]|uniref:Cappuccino-like protein n=1 Tax=Pinctada imbricata TaxID=66713 RepID=A0AA88XZD7_PINIB|nr:hypothetical protein FSP39_015430 [Pinctada imbricata]